MEWMKGLPIPSQATPESFYFARGEPFNRPVMCRVYWGSRRRPNGAYAPEPWYELWADGFVGYPVWYHDAHEHTIYDLEFKGPILP